jgi:hypothetical protein
VLEGTPVEQAGQRIAVGAQQIDAQRPDQPPDGKRHRDVDLQRAQQQKRLTG